MTSYSLPLFSTGDSGRDSGTENSSLGVISLDREQDSSLRWGRILSAPTLLFGDEATVRVSTDFAWELRQPLFQPAPIPTWVVLIFEPHSVRRGCTSPASVEPFIRRLKACLQDFGHLPGSKPNELLQDPLVVVGTQCGSAIEEYLTVFITQWLDQVRRMMPEPPAIIIAVMPDPNDDTRTIIKHRCLTQLGVPLQIVDYSKAVAPRDAILKSLALKINLKLGGTNWILPRAPLPHLSSTHEEIMVIGITTAPLPQGSCCESPGVGVGVVASFDRPLARFVSAADVQLTEPDGEVVNLDEILLKLLVQRRRAYPPIPTSATPRERSEMLQMIYPKIVIVYRVGLKPNQHARAMSKEVAAVRTAMDRVQGELGETGVNPPQMVYLAIGCSTLKVQPVPLAMGDGFGNCAPGSVFDFGFTKADSLDFYLTNSSGLNSAPKLYSVLSCDGVMPNRDLIQQITYNLSFMMGTSACPVSLPSPARYSQLVCKSIQYLWEAGFDLSSATMLTAPHERLALLKSKLHEVPSSHNYKMWFV